MFDGLDEGAIRRAMMIFGAILIPVVLVSISLAREFHKERKKKNDQAREQKILRVPKEEMTNPSVKRFQKDHDQTSAVYLTPNEDSLAPANFQRTWERLNLNDPHPGLEIIEYEPTIPCALYQPAKERVMDTSQRFDRQFVFPPRFDTEPVMVTISEDSMTSLPVGEWEKLLQLLKVHSVNGKELYVMWTDPGEESQDAKIMPGVPELAHKVFFTMPDVPPLLKLSQRLESFTSSIGVCIHFEGRDLRIEVLDPEATGSLVAIAFSWTKMKTILP